MNWRKGTHADVPLLARMNRQLREDESRGAELPALDLERRMGGWLDGEYTAVLFEERDEAVGYALFRDNEGGGTYLRQFFVIASRRRQGVGRRAFELLVREVLPPGSDIILEVLEQNTSAFAFWQALGFRDYARTLRRRGS